MGTITIYIRLVNGTLYYRDNENDHGKTIETSVDPGDSIIWRPDYCSNIKSIDTLNINGNAGFFKKCPTRIYDDVWKAIVADDAKGELSYLPTVSVCNDGSVKAELTASSISKSSFGQDEPAKLKVKL